MVCTCLRAGNNSVLDNLRQFCTRAVAQLHCVSTASEQKVQDWVMTNTVVVAEVLQHMLSV